MSDWADKTFCVHGVNFSTECERCELAGIEESLKWMKRRVARDEKRREVLWNKLTPEFIKELSGREGNE